MYFEVSDNQMRQEREAARQLRQSRWWQTLIVGTQCYYCQTSIRGKDVSMDHIIPISQGGRSNKGNVVPACKACNTRKRDMSAAEWALQDLTKDEPKPL